MKNRLKFMLIIGCVTTMAAMPVQGATLEDSMLKPSQSSEKAEDDKESTEASVFSANTGTITTALELMDLAQDDRVERIGEMCRQDYARTGVLASVSAAQCILESGYLSTELATAANNCFGMKAELSGNTWENSAWDGESLYTKQTGEEYGGQNVTIVADFRQYDSIEASVADHSAYLLGATVDGEQLRYVGLKDETDYRTAIQIIKDGGYATDSSYVDKICSIIERFDLTRFDELPEDSEEEKKASKAKTSGSKDKKTKSNTAKADKESDKSKETANTTLTYDDSLYRVRKSWEDVDSQIGAYKSVEFAKMACEAGYSIFDSQGNSLYSK